MNSSPDACLLRKGILTIFPSRPLIHLGQMNFWAAPSSKCTGILLVVPQIETHCSDVLLSAESDLP